MNMIKVQTVINSTLIQVWDSWTKNEHIVHWNFAADDWHCPNATNNLEIGGEFHYTMAAKNNSFSFDFWGTHQNIETHQKIESILGDGRKMSVQFEVVENGVLVIEQFEPEQQNPPERQQMGWQMILDNFKKYVER